MGSHLIDRVTYPLTAGTGSRLRRQPTGDFKSELKLISYITSKYASKGDMIYDETLWAEIIKPMLPRFKEAGALRQVVSQVWNNEGSFILANTFEYVDEKAFAACK